MEKVKLEKVCIHGLTKMIYQNLIFYTHASPKDGGNGAFYIRLRKSFK